MGRALALDQRQVMLEHLAELRTRRGVMPWKQGVSATASRVFVIRAFRLDSVEQGFHCRLRLSQKEC
jgi:hypothetical protein